MTVARATAYQRNGQPVTAEAFYAIACDPRRSVAVEACAGAGKTWMLVSRIVRALLESPAGELHPQEILAITFTKKAAGEMRERLDEWLKKFAQADDATLRQELAIRGVLHGVHQHSPAALSNLYRSVLATGRSVQIRTFHSWFAALLRNAPVAVLQRLNLPVNYTLLEDDAPALLHRPVGRCCLEGRLRSGGAGAWAVSDRQGPWRGAGQTD
jgi:ATP-dependent helicase/nuclease subunit A